MHGAKPKQDNMKDIRHAACKANKGGYTTPTETKHEVTLTTKSELWHGKIGPNAY